MTTSNSINITDIINTRAVSRYQMGVFFLCALAALMDGYDSVVIGITAPAIAASLSLDVKSFGPVFSAAQFGFMIGAFGAGPLADRLGRKSILILSVVMFGLFSILTPLASNYEQLVALRFLTGLGLGGASATFVSISMEYAPLRMRATIVALMWTMVPAGNVVGGVLSSALLPAHGWETIYYVGGAVPIGVALLMMASIPESASFLVVRGAGFGRLSSIVKRIAPDLVQTPETQYLVSEARSTGAGIKNLFTDGRTLTTVYFWIVFFCCWLVLITVLAWMVPMLREAGIPISKAPLMIATNSAGAVIGAPLIGRAMDKSNAYVVVITGVVIGAISVSILGLAISSVEGFAICAFIEGFALGGTSSGLIALVAAAYPTAIRSTGVGWAIGVSRFGAVVGPIFAGAILSSGRSATYVFGSMGVLCVIAAAFLVVLMQAENRKSRMAASGSVIA